MNHIALMGRFVADPAISATNSGKQLCKFTLAVKRPHSSDMADFIDVLAWEATAQFVTRYFSKGQRVAVDGYLGTVLWEDKAGKKHKSYEVIAQNVYFADGKPPIENKARIEEENVNEDEDDSEFDDDDF